MDYNELLKQAYKEALNSPDPSTQNGALLVDDEGIVLHRDHNRFPTGVEYKAERWERPLKYKFIEHSERRCIYLAAQAGMSTQGLTMVCGWAACSDCARAIIESGVKRLVRHKQASDRSPEFWLAEIKVADMMLKEAGVEIIDYDGKIGVEEEVLHSGKKWRP